MLRGGDPVPLQLASERIEGLVDRVASAGVETSLECGPRALPSAIDPAAHRVVQEGPTR